jgi:hypothetical protein
MAKLHLQLNRWVNLTVGLIGLLPSEANLYLLLRLIAYAVVFSVQLLLETTPVGTCNSERFGSAYISDTVYAYEGRGDLIYSVRC